MTTQASALITGITGQDGSYLAELLLNKGYEVHGIIRRASNFNTHRIEHIYQDPHEENQQLYLHYGDLTDSSNISRLIERIAPDEIYNLAAQSHVKVSFEVPEYTAQVDALGALRLLDAIKESRVETRFYQASTSEMFGDAAPPQNEQSPFRPRSPYAASKLYAHWLTKNYREAYGIHASCGILFNHESPRRGKRFVTRKISRAVARIKHDLQDRVFLGNLEARRDWGYAPEYVKGMWQMLQKDEPDDYVLATGQDRSVREFCELAFEAAGMPLKWTGEGLEETGVHAESGEVLVEIDPEYFRPTEVQQLLGDASKARNSLGWEAETTLEELVEIMVEHDLNMISRVVTLREQGYDVIEQGVNYSG